MYKRGEPKTAGRAAMLSAFLMPGAGQVYNGQKIKGVIIMIAVLTALSFLVVPIAQYIFVYETSYINMATGQASAVPLPSTGRWWIWLIFLLVVHLGSVLDAYLVGEKKYGGAVDAQRID